MKKILFSSVLLFIILAMPSYASGETVTFPLKSTVYFRNSVAYPMDVSPMILDNRVYVPVRYLAHSIDIPDSSILSFSASNSVYLNAYDKTLGFTIGSKFYTVNGEQRVMDVAPFIFKDRTMLPASFVAREYDKTVNWDAATQTVIISWANEQAVQDPQSNAAVKQDQKLVYRWEYDGQKWTWESGIDYELASTIVQQYSQKAHPLRTYKDFVSTYCLDKTDDKLISSVITQLKKGGDPLQLSKDEMVAYVIAFVQGFTYVTDSDSTGYDEYPRYPVETLLEQSGDCEDTAILLATLLRELGYGCALIVFDNHCALGIKGDVIPGTYFEVNGSRYYYVETTSKGWKIGDLPDEYKGMKARILPVP